jgi:hypothetical protein
MFQALKPPRAKRRNLMHVTDSGWDGEDIAAFECKHCGYKSEWLFVPFYQQKRGIPCLRCNKEKTP